MAYTLTILDTASIQSYIFGSNELRENIGASELVYRATKLWAFEALEAVLGNRHNINMGDVKADDVDFYDHDFAIEQAQQSGPAAEVLYAGGGNTVILFGGDNSLETAKTFVNTLSRRVLRDAPGLNLYAAHGSVQELSTGQALTDAIDMVFKELAQIKEALPGPTPLLGLSVTAACTSTGLPANAVMNPTHYMQEAEREPDRIVSNQVIAKWNAARTKSEKEQAPQEGEPVRSATQRLRKHFKDIQPEFHWTDNLDKIGNLGRGESYIAVVHADGNGMGIRMREYSIASSDGSARDYIVKMRNFSLALQKTALAALNQTVTELLKAVTRTLNKGELPQYASKEGKKYFPFRPIVFGGDDVTWVCAGPWGLPLAKHYLQALEEGDPLPDGKLPYASAGVTIVKTHYPFSRAYEMSEALLKSAKARVKDRKPDKLASGIDWHFTTTGLSGDLEDIREREYTVRAGSLLMRPLVWQQDNVFDWRNWANFLALLREFQGENWKDRRNKIHALREALRGGDNAVQQFVTIYLSSEEKKENQKLPALSGFPEKHNTTGWVDGRCLYFDAIEMHDQFFDLIEGKESA